MQRILLIDGDIIVYRFSVQTESAFEWTPGEPTFNGDVDAAVKAAKEWTEGLQVRLNADEVLVAFSDPSRRYFRHDLWADYKAHRTQGRPPIHRDEVSAALKDALPSKWKSNLEADDVLGILATSAYYKPGWDKVVVSLDKDLATIPGSHFNYDKDDEVRLLSETEADIFHMTQTLTGDPCDGFSGCPGIGPVRAKKILDPTDGDCLLMWEAVVQAFHLRGLTADDALRNARMARILRACDYDFANQRAIPWQPPTPKEN